MRRSPVLHDGGAAIPADPAVQFLQICSALRAGRDEIALVPGLELEAAQVLAFGVAAERAPHPRRQPAGAAHMTGQPAPTVLNDVAEAGGSPAERTHAKLPHAVRQMLSDHDEIALEERPKGGRADERYQRGIESNVIVDGAEPSARGKQRRRRESACVPG